MPQIVIVADMVHLLEMSLFTEEENIDIIPDSDESSDDMKQTENENETDMHYCDSEANDDFLDKNGKLDYGLKLSNFLPILQETKKLAKDILRTNDEMDSKKNKGNNENALKEMICIFGMECNDNELNNLYAFWRNWNIDRFLRCKFNETNKTIAIKYDNETRTEFQKNIESKEQSNEDSDIEMSETKQKTAKRNTNDPPTVYCYVTSHSIDMIAMTKGSKKQS